MEGRALKSRRIRWGLCCQFAEHPVKFRTTTAAAALRLSTEERSRKLAELCAHNVQSLWETLAFCRDQDIGCFRVNSQILPLATHPLAGYELCDLPGGAAIIADFEKCGAFAAEHDIRLTFHPDQYVVLNSPREEVVASSIAEIEYQTQVAQWIGADVINIHAGGAYGNKPGALATFEGNLARLSPAARQRLTIENDDTIYSPADLLPLCRSAGLPLVYDVHHHRCLPDSLSIEEATSAAAATWDREPLFHISSPRDTWQGARPERHHDYIDAADFPDAWRTLSLTIEVEAKAKELAVLRLRDDLLKKPQKKARVAGRAARHLL
jgi:UV DNA damage endonuclease